MAARNGDIEGNAVTGIDGLICFWDFRHADRGEYAARGARPYRLKEMNGPLRRADEGPFGSSVLIDGGKWLGCPRGECPDLNVHGRHAQLTVAAWVKRSAAASAGCEFIAGMWNETAKKRQYGLFLNLQIWNSAEQVCGHVSSAGGPTPGCDYCMTSSIGSTPVPKGEWHFVAFAYDGAQSRAYLDGRLDRRDAFNPFDYPEGLYDGGADGADFTVGAVNRSGEIGNFYNGLLGGLAVFGRALSETELAALHRRTESLPR